MAQRNYLPGHEIKLIHSGNEYFEDLIKLIDSAKNILHLQVYIFDDDATGKQIVASLIDATSRGVKVYLMVDGFGSHSLKDDFQKMLKAAKIFFRFFSPLPFPGITQSARRLHIKVCVADGMKAIVGGINIADKYHGDKEHLPWLDYALFVEGEVCEQLDTFCNKIWKRRFTYRKKITPKHSNSNDPVLVRMSQNDWLRGKNEISAGYKHMLGNAKKEIIIVASYFIPTRRLLKILTFAARQGREIHIVLAHNSDVPFIKSAITYLYDLLLRNKIRIYEYNDAVLHAKVCVIDNSWVSIGSHNLNHLSEFMSVEMNLDVLDENFAHRFADELKTLIREHCTEIRIDEYKNSKSIFKQFFNWSSYRFISFTQRILYMLNRREGKAIHKSKKGN